MGFYNLPPPSEYDNRWACGCWRPLDQRDLNVLIFNNHGLNYSEIVSTLLIKYGKPFNLVLPPFQTSLLVMRLEYITPRWFECRWSPQINYWLKHTTLATLMIAIVLVDVEEVVRTHQKEVLCYSHQHQMEKGPLFDLCLERAFFIQMSILRADNNDDLKAGSCSFHSSLIYMPARGSYLGNNGRLVIGSSGSG